MGGSIASAAAPQLICPHPCALACAGLSLAIHASGGCCARCAHVSPGQHVCSPSKTLLEPVPSAQHAQRARGLCGTQRSRRVGTTAVHAVQWRWAPAVRLLDRLACGLKGRLRMQVACPRSVG